MLIKFLLKLFNCHTVNYLRWERIPCIHDSIEDKVFQFIRSKSLTNHLEAIVTSGACEIGSYTVINVGIVKAMEYFKYLY